MFNLWVQTSFVSSPLFLFICESSNPPSITQSRLRQFQMKTINALQCNLSSFPQIEHEICRKIHFSEKVFWIVKCDAIFLVGMHFCPSPVAGSALWEGRGEMHRNQVMHSVMARVPDPGRERLFPISQSPGQGPIMIMIITVRFINVLLSIMWQVSSAESRAVTEVN